MALGTGLLIGSVSFELIDEALKTQTVARVGAGRGPGHRDLILASYTSAPSGVAQVMAAAQLY
jgi:hypothetical protein